MNHIYSVFWNQALGRFCVTSELGRSRSRATQRRNAGPGLRIRLAALAAAMAWALPAWSQAVLPQGAQVVSGNVQLKQAGNQLTVQQGSAKAIVDWQSFNIGKNQQVTFQQPNASSVALNRVVGADASTIHGSLQANGKVFLVNPNGVLFGQGANVNVASLVASTLNISNENFLKGNYQFSGLGADLQGGSVVNLGRITAAEHGAVALLGGSVSNHGAIAARLGSVALAAGNQISLDFAGDGLLHVQVTESAVNALAENHELLQADGGSVLIAAKATDALLQTVVNNTGMVQARTVENREGKIVLLGGFHGGTAQVAGTLDASAGASGDGGFIETSGAHVKIAGSARITSQAAQGRSGTWLIDPNDFTVAASGGDMTGPQVEKALADNGTFTIATATMGTAGGQGDIHINDNITWNANKLTLNAERNIDVNAVMSVNGTGTLALNYGDTRGSTDQLPTADSHLKVDGQVDFANTGTGLLNINGHSYHVINTLADLQNIGTDANLASRWALGGSIDASTTDKWNEGLGFEPIGGVFGFFSGIFDGLGHTIQGLTINRPNQDYVGLFGSAQGATLRNVGLVGGSISGRNHVGGMAGGLGDSQHGTAGIFNAYTTAKVSGAVHVGGLVGYQQSADGASTISNAYATGNVAGIGIGASVGGLVGKQQASSAFFPGPAAAASISNAYATGTVTGNFFIGGLVGDQDSKGGAASISNAYATGIVTGRNYTGGLVGRTTPGTHVNNVYWNSETTGQAASAGGGTPLTTAQMFDTQRWGDFGFGTVWGNINGQTTPYLLGLAGNRVFNRNDVPAAGTITAANRPPLYTAVLDLTQLQAMQGKLDGNYVLGRNIDASATASWDNGRGFVPIGDATSPFRGIFDGLGHTIGGLSIDRPDLDHAGLFGAAENATLRNVGLAGGSVEGSNFVGALVGSVSVSNGGQASISNVFATGNVTGKDAVGGLVGSALIREGSMSSTSNAYATGNVTGVGGVGGLVGKIDNHGGASISNAYATGLVTGQHSVGGLVGKLTPGADISNAYWNSETTGQAASAGGGTALSTAQMFDTHRWGNLGFGTVWDNIDGQTTPYLLGLAGNRVFIKNDMPASGVIAADNRPPLYTPVFDVIQLQAMQGKRDGNYVLGRNLDASATASWDDGRGFVPIGDAASPFRGIFDGLGHTVSGLSIRRPALNYVGLFGSVENATLRNVGLVGGNVTGSDFVGALVGRLSASNDRTASISNVFATADVTGKYAVGGLVGLNQPDYKGTSSISNAYATGNVEGSMAVGGLVGLASSNATSSASISTTYATRKVTGLTRVGGLVGRTGPAVNVSNSYWNSETTGQATSADGGTPLTTVQMFDTHRWDNLGFGTVWGNANGQTTPYLRSLAGNRVFNKNDMPAAGVITADNRPPLYTLVFDVTQLQAMQGTLDGNYALGRNIDASATATWDDGRGFVPIGDAASPFRGIFDGLGHGISGLTIRRPDRNFMGLFGSVENATLRNVRLEQRSVLPAGNDNAGPLPGTTAAASAMLPASGT